MGSLPKGLAALVVALPVSALFIASPVHAESSKGSNKPSVSAVAGLTYTVRAGDGLSIIASRVKVSFNDLLAVNGFKSSSVILPGQVIVLPDYATVSSAGSAGQTSSASSAVAATPANESVTSSATYTVRKGDGLSIIASRVKVSMNDLLAVNGFTKTTVILPGQIIKLPASATVASSPSTNSSQGSSSTVSSGTVSTGAAGAVAFAKSQIGKAYKFYTAGPNTYDCSGLTKAAYASVGVSLPHQSLAQSKMGVAIDWRTDSIRPGDLVFTYSSRNATQISHVGIAISSTQWVEAPFTGGSVRISNLPSVDRIQAVRRIVNG